MGKKQTFQSSSNILAEAEIHKIPKIRENWIPIEREKYGKTQTFQIYEFLKYFGWSRNPYNSQNLGKVNFHNTGKVWEKKNKYSKVMGFSNSLSEAEMHTIPKIWKKWIPIVREKYGKTQTFQSNRFLKYFGWSRNPYNSQNMGKVNLHSTGKVRENTEISHSLRYLADLALMRTHEFPMFVNVQIPIKWKYSVESHIIPRLWVFEEIRSYYETQVIHRVWVM